MDTETSKPFSRIRPTSAFAGMFVLMLTLLVVGTDPILGSNGFSLPLTITNTSAMNYASEPITSGVPLSKQINITTTDNLVITKADGTSVPAQYRVLSRYGPLYDSSRPIKWVLVDFQVDVAPRETSIYYLKKGEQGSVPGITVTERREEIVVNTGALTFAIPRSHFQLFKNVTISGHSIPMVTGDPEAGIVIEKGGKIFSSYYDDSPVVVVEEKGPLRTVIKAAGKFRSAEGELLVGGDARMYLPPTHKPKPEGYPLTYTVRIYAYKEKSYLKIVTTLENDGNTINTYYPVNDIFIDGHYLRIRLSGMTETLVGRTATAASSIQSSDTLSLFQDHRIIDEGDESRNFLYTVKRNGREISSGKRSDGWMTISDAQGRGVALSMRYFWQNHKKELVWKDGYLQMGILPGDNVVPENGGYFTHYAVGNHYFSGGWHKTCEIFLYALDGALPASEMETQIRRFNHPLFARCDKEWYADSRAWSLIAPSRFPTKGLPKLNRDALDRYEDYIGMFVDETKDRVNHLTIEKLRESRGWWPNSKADWYGWENFGDMSWGANTWCSLVYDWPFSFWLHYMRTNDERYRVLAKEATDHHIDLDLIKFHGGPASYGGDGTWMWEAQGGEFVNNHHRSTSASGFYLTHTWNGGYALGYLLTGEYRYLEAVRRTADAVRAAYSSKRWGCLHGKNVVFTQSRAQGWAILLLVNEYRITGDRQNLEDAMKIFRHSLLYMERLPEFPGSNGQGYILYKDTVYDRKGIVTFLTYPLEPLCELHYEAVKAGVDVSDLESYLKRSLNWLKDYAYVGGNINHQGHYSLLTISYATDPRNPEKNMGGALAHNILVAGAFGYMSDVLKQTDPRLSSVYLDFARNAFKDLMLYRTANKKRKNDYLDPNSYSPVSWGWLPTMPKEMGWIGRGGQFYLHAEYLRRSRDAAHSPRP